ncbi:hypothetical protein MOKP64_12560 [Mycobacterium avium subsp. hominissuis]
MEPKCRNSTASDVPASLAISRVVVPEKPRFANIVLAVSISSVRSSALDLRERLTAGVDPDAGAAVAASRHESTVITR